jgi:hypothetical protein
LPNTGASASSGASAMAVVADCCFSMFVSLVRAHWCPRRRRRREGSAGFRDLLPRPTNRGPSVRCAASENIYTRHCALCSRTWPAVCHGMTELERARYRAKGIWPRMRAALPIGTRKRGTDPKLYTHVVSCGN